MSFTVFNLAYNEATIAVAAVCFLIGILISRLWTTWRTPAAAAMRRASDTPFAVDQEKFSTQRNVTYVLLGVFIGVTTTVMFQNDQSERSMILQTVINLTLLGVGYWFGASKAAADSGTMLGKIAEGAAPSQARAVAAARAPAPTESIIPPEISTPSAEALTAAPAAPAAEVKPTGDPT